MFAQHKTQSPGPYRWGYNLFAMPNKHDPIKHHRRSIRRPNWDYTTPGPYFITICTHQREHLFEDAVLKEIVKNAWLNIPSWEKAQHILLDEWIVMPNHIHVILWIVYEKLMQMIADGIIMPANTEHDRQHGAAQGSIGAVVGSFKSQATRRVNNIRKSQGARVWQRGYWDRIIRNERELDATREYIRNNPTRWAEDRENLDNLLEKMTFHPNP